MIAVNLDRRFAAGGKDLDERTSRGYGHLGGCTPASGRKTITRSLLLSAALILHCDDRLCALIVYRYLMTACQFPVHHSYCDRYNYLSKLRRTDRNCHRADWWQCRSHRQHSEYFNSNRSANANSIVAVFASSR